MSTEIKYGLITGIAVCIWVFIEYLLGFHTANPEAGEFTGYFAFIIPIVTIFLGIKEKREMHYDGLISVSHGVKTGILISLYAGIISSVFYVVYYRFINPDYINIAIQFEKQRLETLGRSPAEISAQIEQTRMMFSPVYQFIAGLISTLLTGLLISIVLSLLLKRKGKVIY